ncbi:Alkanesulfonate utilization operon LysR-family regulator CbI [Levilactobacillus zymae]|uniref:Alkanesulfonate utilization operon LysR-family regulator CbI n=2 Tax=Levilactobacillus zymae TaxID=267363 RepID=A0A1Y6JVM6_9LACO|nr:Alkanesulfonate utilization operon LysR-family regulator CbI [Levilactobacillus zymae]
MLNMNSMQLKCLISLGQTHSITRTAAKLYVAQSTVSKNLKRLEDELGFPILTVQAHQTHLTSEGQYLWTHMQKLDAQFTAVIEHIYAQKASTPITVAHSIIPFERAFLPLFIQRFAAHHQRPVHLINFSPSAYADSLNLLLQQEATFLLMQEDFFRHDSRISFTPLLQARYSVVIPRQHPLAAQPLIALDDLTHQHLWVWNSEPPVQSVVQVSQLIRDQVPSATLTPVANIAECAMYAASDAGLGIVPSVAYDTGNPDVVYNFLDVPIPINYGVSYLRTTKKEAYFPAVIHDLTTAVKTKKDLWS